MDSPPPSSSCSSSLSSSSAEESAVHSSPSSSSVLTCSPRPSCRICREPDPFDDLVSPCECKGSVGFVHSSCLSRWLKIKYPQLISSSNLKGVVGGSSSNSAVSDATSRPAVAAAAADYTHGYSCEICNFSYRLLVSPIGWHQFVKVSLSSTFSSLHSLSWASLSWSNLRQTLSRNKHTSFKLGFHLFYAFFVLAKLRIFAKLVLLAKASGVGKFGLGLGVTIMSFMLSQYFALLWMDLKALLKYVQAIKSRHSVVTILY